MALKSSKDAAQLASQKSKAAKKKSRHILTNTQILIATSVCIIAFIVAMKFDFSSFLSSSSQKQLKFWSICLGNWNKNGNLRSMHRVFERLGYKQSDKKDWDFVWSIEGPLVSPYDKIKKFKKHQKINHFPGNIDLVIKVYMNYANENQKFILPTFQMAHEQKEIEEYIQNNPTKKFVRKNFHNRGVEIIDAKDMNANDPEEFYQVFLDNPFLIDGHAFDIGVFVLVSSVNPLRVYKFDHEILLRFCAKQYHPFDAKDTDRYVVQDGHKSFYEMKSFGDDYRKYAGSMKQLFERHIKMRGFNVTKMWEDIDYAIVTAVKNSEQRMVQTIESSQHANHNFFELVRFDFMIDENLNVYVMEVNMSPNMTPAEERFEENSLIYEPLIYTTIQMVGGGNYHEFMSRFSNDTTIINKKHLVTSIDNCIANDCINSCDKPECELCLTCLSNDQMFQIREAYREWKYQGEYKRVFPKSEHLEDEELVKEMNENTKFMMKWYDSMCKEDARWC